MDTNGLSVAILLPWRFPYCFRIRTLLMEFEGLDSEYSSSQSCSIGMTTFSTTGNLLFGNLQH